MLYFVFFCLMLIEINWSQENMGQRRKKTIDISIYEPRGPTYACICPSSPSHSKQRREGRFGLRAPSPIGERVLGVYIDGDKT